MGLHVKQIFVDGYDKNFSYLIYDDVTNNTAVVDPCGNLDKIFTVIEKNKLDLVGVLVTHSHFDHSDKLDELLRSYALPVHIHTQGTDRIISQSPIFPMRDKETLILGAHQIYVLYTPGHIDDAVCFYIAPEHAHDGVGKIVTGDTLFVGGCGRTDAAGVRALYDSLQRLAALPDTTVVYPGHDYGRQRQSTIGHEKKHNPYLLAKNFSDFKKIRLGV